MTPHHHPSDAIITEYVAGALRPAFAVVVAAHLEGCVQCRRAVEAFEALGGAMVEDLAGAELSDDALDRVMAGIERPYEDPPAPPPPAAERIPFGREMWIGPGMGIRKARIDDSGDLLYLLRLPAGLQTHPERAWRDRSPGPGAVLAMLGVEGRLPQLPHHTLFFTRDWGQNFGDIFGKDARVPDPASIVDPVHAAQGRVQPCAFHPPKFGESPCRIRIVSMTHPRRPSPPPPSSPATCSRAGRPTSTVKVGFRGKAWTLWRRPGCSGSPYRSHSAAKGSACARSPVSPKSSRPPAARPR